MSNYVKATNFAAKDALVSGNPSKIIKGQEIDDEYNALATAIGTKADTNSPTFTGVPIVPTATPITLSTTQAASTAFVQNALVNALQLVYPVGAIFTATVATNPATLFGFGTWVAFGIGRVMVGVGGAFTAGDTGGSADAVVVSHTHTGTANTTSLTGSLNATSQSNIFGTVSASGIVTATNIVNSYVSGSGGGTANSRADYSINATHTHSLTIDSAGVSGTNANLQPYVVVYMWNRTA